MSTPVITIDNPGDMITSVARMFGFQPTDSIVIVTLKGKRLRIGLTLRYDLVVADHDPVGLVDQAAARVRLEAAREVFVIVYADTPRAIGEDLPYRELADLFEAKWRFPMREMVYTAEGRWWSYLCNDPVCCPPEGKPVETGSTEMERLAAERAFLGQTMLPDRAALVASVGPDDDETAESRVDAIEAKIYADTATDVGERRRRVVELVSDLVDRFEDPRARVDDAEVVELAALMWHVHVRDEVLVQGADEQRRGMLLRVFRQVVRRVPPPYDAPVCSMLSWFAYADGDGVMANIALDRALRSDPDYSLARLIEEGLARQVPPSRLRQVMIGAAEDLEGRSAAG